MLVDFGRIGPAGLSRLSVRRRRRGDRQQRADPDREPAGSRRQRRRDLPGVARQAAVLDPAAGSPDIHPHGGDRRPRGRAQVGAAGGARDQPDRHQAAVRRQERCRGRQGRIRRRVRRARRQAARPRRPALRTPEDGVALPVVSPEFVLGVRAGQVDQPRCRRRSRLDGGQGRARQPGAAARPLPARRQIIRRGRADHLGAVRRRLVLRRQRRYA